MSTLLHNRTVYVCVGVSTRPSLRRVGTSVLLLRRESRASQPRRAFSGDSSSVLSSDTRIKQQTRDLQQTTTPESPDNCVAVKLIGFGSRGAAALEKLYRHGAIPASTTELWCLDLDKSLLDGLGFAKSVLIQSASGEDSNSAPLRQEDLAALVGRPASDASGRGNIGSADGSVAFVLAPASGIPGGPAVLLQVTKALRAAGHFTVAAVTAPFAFEGNAKAEQATALVDDLEESAHLVAVMEQQVLLQAFGDSQLTVTQATDIANNALEHTARSILQAVQAQEILKSSRGGLMWHGRDLRHYKRLLSPPLQQLLTCPGTAVLGRGLAALPVDVVQSMGVHRSLMHLASDAVIAAGGSPFLDGVLDTASAVLCCINLPPFQEDAKAPRAQTERHSTRMAAQAAAGALRSITGSACDDFVISAEPRKSADQISGSNSDDVVQVEATLLVLRAPHNGVSSEGAGAPSLTKSMTEPGIAASRGEAKTNPPASQPRTSVPRETSGGRQAGPAKLPPSNWSMMSAMAGGTKANVSKENDKSTQPAAPSNAGARGTSSSAGPPKNVVQSTAAIFSGKPSSREPPQGREAAIGSSSDTLNSEEESSVLSVGGGRVTVGDYLADSLTAQSLDLPPAAARWRQAQRADQYRKRRLIVWEVDEVEPWMESEEKESSRPAVGLAGLLRVGGRKEEKKVDIKRRVAGMLAQDREDTWE